MFVRLKKVKNSKYAYLVENEWTPWGSRQKVVRYLGRAIFIDEKKQEYGDLPEGFHMAIIEACAQTLQNHGFSRKGHELEFEDVVVNLQERTVKRGSRNVVLSIHEGYLCEDTLKQLMKYTPEERHEASARKLAQMVLEAGLKLSDEQFVHLFDQVKSI